MEKIKSQLENKKLKLKPKLENKMKLKLELEILNCNKNKKFKLNLNFKNYKKSLITTLMLEERKKRINLMNCKSS